MLSMRKPYPFLFLFLFLIGPVLLLSACSLLPIPSHPMVRCEAMQPYVSYHGIYYPETSGNTLKGTDLGSVVTTVGDGSNQATSCLLDSGTPLYSVKGYPVTSRLATNDQGHIILFEAKKPHK